MRTPGTIEVSEADYRRLVDERRALLKALKSARLRLANYDGTGPMAHAITMRAIDAAIKLAESDEMADEDKRQRAAMFSRGDQ
jgi:hypothetical protein